MRLRRPKIFYGWWIVLVSLIADGMKHGSFNRGFTVMYVPVENDLLFPKDVLGFSPQSRTLLGLAEGLGRFMGGVQGPLMGYCTDRFGPRVMLAFGGLMSGLGFILLARATNFWWFLFVFVVFLSVGFRSGYNNASIAAVNNWFWRRRGLAMSIVSMGNGLGGASAYLVGLLVFMVGWRDACTILGIVIIAVVIPLSYFLKRAPEEMGLLPDGDPPELATTSANDQLRSQQRRRSRGGELDFTAKEAMRTPSYWLLVMSTGFRNIVHAGASFLMAPLIIWFLEAGVPVDPASDQGQRFIIIAAAFVSGFSVLNMVFNPGMGWLGDRVDRRKLSSVCMLSGAAALASLLTQSGEMWQVVVFVLLLAFSESANPLNWAIMGRLLWAAGLRDAARLATPARPAGIHVDGHVDGSDLRLHRQLLLGSLPSSAAVYRGGDRLLVPAASADAQAVGTVAGTRHSTARARGAGGTGRDRRTGTGHLGFSRFGQFEPHHHAGDPVAWAVLQRPSYDFEPGPLEHRLRAEVSVVVAGAFGAGTRVCLHCRRAVAGGELHGCSDQSHGDATAAHALPHRHAGDHPYVNVVDSRGCAGAIHAVQLVAGRDGDPSHRFIVLVCQQAGREVSPCQLRHKPSAGAG